ncbi:MAG: hypothetical protein Q8L51_03090 [Candidatus Amesbacteria bacterium]|nr:hypothetical protein [Candidatus Amesbacteria bacterium]
MVENSLFVYMSLLIKKNIGVASKLLLSQPSGTSITFSPGSIFSEYQPVRGYDITISLNPSTINVSRTMALQDLASFPSAIGVIFKPEDSRQNLVGSIGREAFLFLIAYSTYMGDTKRHLYALLNPHYID